MAPIFVGYFKQIIPISATNGIYRFQYITWWRRGEVVREGFAVMRSSNRENTLHFLQYL
jgi:hypothetical protein